MTTPLEIMRQLGPQTVDVSPQAKALGLKLVSLDKGEAVLRCPYRADLVGDPTTGVIAGGVVTTLLDHTCGQAVIAAMDVYRQVVTLDLRIDYMRPAEPGLDIFAYAHCYKLTRSVAFVRAVAYDKDRDDSVATVQATFVINGDRPEPSRDEADQGGDVS